MEWEREFDGTLCEEIWLKVASIHKFTDGKGPNISFKVFPKIFSKIFAQMEHVRWKCEGKFPQSSFSAVGFPSQNNR